MRRGGDIARQHAMMRGFQRHHLLGHRLAAFEDRGKGIGNGHQRHGTLLDTEGRERARHILGRFDVNG